MFICLFVLSKGLKQMGRRMQIFVMIGIDLCFQLRFSHVFFFLTSERGEACLSTQYWAHIVSCCI